MNKLNQTEILLQLGKNIKNIRNELNLSQEALALTCDFDRTYISLLERGQRNISFINLLRLANGLETDLSTLTKGIKWH